MVRSADVFVSLVAVCGLASLAVHPSAVTPPDVVEASEFRLTTADGQVRGVWSATEEGTVFAMSDDSGLARFEMTASSANGSMILKLTDPEGQPRALWGVDADGSMTFLSVGDQAKPRFVINSSSSEAANLQIHDTNGQRRCQMGLLDSGAASFALFEPRGSVVAQLATALGGRSFEPALSLYDEETGHMRLTCAVVDQDPSVMLYGDGERARSTWMLAGEGGGLAWLDAQGRQRGVFGSNPSGDTGVVTHDADGRATSRVPAQFDR